MGTIVQRALAVIGGYVVINWVVTEGKHWYSKKR
jgi:hypothetical protein